MAKEQKNQSRCTSGLTGAEENLRKAQQRYERLIRKGDKDKAKEALVEKRAAAAAQQAARRNRPAKPVKTIKTTEG